LQFQIGTRQAIAIVSFVERISAFFSVVAFEKKEKGNVLSGPLSRYGPVFEQGHLSVTGTWPSS
jgi:hypothetical protein